MESTVIGGAELDGGLCLEEVEFEAKGAKVS